MKVKGQLTVEYLLLALVSLSLIAVSVSALAKIREAGEFSYRAALFRSGALDIYNAGEELCAMGSGNSISLTIRESLTVSDSGSGDEILFSAPELNLSSSKKKTASCAYADASIPANSHIKVINEQGEIRITAAS